MITHEDVHRIVVEALDNQRKYLQVGCVLIQHDNYMEAATILKIYENHAGNVTVVIAPSK